MYYQKRVCVLYCIVLFLVFVLCARLYSLSTPDSNRAMEVLEGQYTGKISVAERSGFVYDRNCELLSHKKTGCVALVNPAECKDAKRLSTVLSGCSKVLSMSQIYERISNGVPFTMSVSEEGSAKILKAGENGVYVYTLYEENTDIASHFLGYTDADGKGVTGLRRHFNDLLSKQLFGKAEARFETNAKRQSLSPFTLDDETYKGYDGIVTTIDKDLQSFCDGLGEKIGKGAVAVCERNSGEILALSSFPSYDAQKLHTYLDSDKGELVNRVTSSFTPGSVFKIVVAAAALESDESLWDYEYTCTGQTEVDEAVFRCHKKSGHGVQRLADAFANSCNTYFISLAQRIGIEKIAETARKIGLDESTRADFLGESESFFMDENNQTPGYLANISFGQGDLCLSPLDMLKVVTWTTLGYNTPLSVIKGEIADGKRINSDKKEKERVFSKNTCEKILLMMEKCVNEGTGMGAKVDNVFCAGKTATAQTGRFDEEGVEYVHKWFCGVCKTEKSDVAVCVLLESESEENASPAVIFSEICKFLCEKSS